MTARSATRDRRRRPNDFSITVRDTNVRPARYCAFWIRSFKSLMREFAGTRSRPLTIKWRSRGRYYLYNTMFVCGSQSNWNSGRLRTNAAM